MRYSIEPSERTIQKTAEATGNLIGNNIGDKISKKSSQNNFDEAKINKDTKRKVNSSRKKTTKS